MRFFSLLFRLVHRNCLIFRAKVNLDNTYTLAIWKLFGKFLIPSNPILILLKRLKNEVFPTFLQIGASELSDFLELKSIQIIPTHWKFCRWRDPCIACLLPIYFLDFLKVLIKRKITILAIFWYLVWLFRGPQNYIFQLFKSVF